MTEQKREFEDTLSAFTVCKDHFTSKKITIDLEHYRELRKDSIKLSMLESGGVDNWEWYGESLYPDEDGYDIDIDEKFAAIDEELDS